MIAVPQRAPPNKSPWIVIPVECWHQLITLSFLRISSIAVDVYPIKKRSDAAHLVAFEVVAIGIEDLIYRSFLAIN